MCHPLWERDLSAVKGVGPDHSHRPELKGLLAEPEFLLPGTSQGNQGPAACDLDGNRVRPFSGILRNLAQSWADLPQPLAEAGLG